MTNPPRPPAVVWSDVVRRIEARAPIPPLAGETKLCPQEPRSWPLRTGPLAPPPEVDVDEDGLPAPLPARPYADVCRNGGQHPDRLSQTMRALGSLVPTEAQAAAILAVHETARRHLLAHAQAIHRAIEAGWQPAAPAAAPVPRPGWFARAIGWFRR